MQLLRITFVFVDEEEHETAAVNDLAFQLKEEKKSFLKKKRETSILKRGGSRESEVIEPFFRFVIIYLIINAYNEPSLVYNGYLLSFTLRHPVILTLGILN